MAEVKTKLTGASVADFLNPIPDVQIRQDSLAIVGIMQAVTKAKPEMWGPGIVGFGRCYYVYPDGRKTDWMLTAFAPRKNKNTLYILDKSAECQALLAKLGKHACGGGCLHIRRLSDVHLPTLKKMVRASVQKRKKASSKAARV